MIISFTGAQSTGKTTLLTKCKELYPDYEFVDEVTRYVKREYNVNINEGGTDITQLLIINQHIQNAFRHIPENKKGVIMDRCIVDGLVYTVYLAAENKISRWVADYARNIFDLLITRVDKIFYTWPGDVPLVDDGERSINNEFRDKIITTFDLLFDTYNDNMKDKLVILKGTVDERLNLIKETLC
jgi:nicotinamide riboside kinase